MSNSISPIAAALAAGLAATLAGPAIAAAPAAPLHPAALQAAAPSTGKAPTRVEVQNQADGAFRKADSNGDGFVSKAEVETARVAARQQAAAAIETRLGQEFSQLDTDKNGSLSQAEFRAAAPSLPADDPSATTQFIQRLDGNKDGKISMEEYRGPMLAIFDRLDTNKDGVVSPAEAAKAPK